jgi:hypothetical protein
MSYERTPYNSNYGRGQSRYDNRGGYQQRNTGRPFRNKNSHDYGVVPNLVYVSKTDRINMGKITKAVYDRSTDKWELHFPNGSMHTFIAADINEGARVILSNYYYLLKVADDGNKITKINVNAIIKAKLDPKSGEWFINMVGGEAISVKDSFINDGGVGREFGCSNMALAIDNDIEMYKINLYFISSIVRGVGEGNENTYEVSYNDAKAENDVFYHSELTEQGLIALSKYRSAIAAGE